MESTVFSWHKAQQVKNILILCSSTSTYIQLTKASHMAKPPITEERKYILILMGGSEKSHGIWHSYGKSGELGAIMQSVMLDLLDHNYLHAFHTQNTYT